MKIIKYNESYFEQTSNLLAHFRMLLRSFKSIDSEPDYKDARRELQSFSEDPNYPIYLCVEKDEVLGYMILKIDGVVWVEQIYVSEVYRRKGVASLLYQKAEEISEGDTLFNYVHPNNDVMINFLKSKGYTVLNLIEIRKPFKDEKPNKKVKVGDHEFDY